MSRSDVHTQDAVSGNHPEIFCVFIFAQEVFFLASLLIYLPRIRICLPPAVSHGYQTIPHPKSQKMMKMIHFHYRWCPWGYALILHIFLYGFDWGKKIFGRAFSVPFFLLT